eukprot:1067576-Pelagomonas_calceolata.AAC.1
MHPEMYCLSYCPSTHNKEPSSLGLQESGLSPLNALKCAYKGMGSAAEGGPSGLVAAALAANIRRA